KGPGGYASVLHLVEADLVAASAIHLGNLLIDDKVFDDYPFDHLQFGLLGIGQKALVFLKELFLSTVEDFIGIASNQCILGIPVDKALQIPPIVGIELLLNNYGRGFLGHKGQSIPARV